MQKGQGSFDLLLALLATTILISSLTTFSENITQSTEEAAIQNELKTILLDTYAAIGAVKAYGVEIQYTSPVPKLANTNAPIECVVQRNVNSLEISSGAHFFSYEGIDLSDIDFPAGGINDESFNCGQQVTISKVGP